jgi:hypothetical protein
MNFAFHPEAEVELNLGIGWYEARTPGLGLRFADEVHASILRALAFPYAWQVLEGDIRRTLVNRYPYSVLYALEPDRLFMSRSCTCGRDPAIGVAELDFQSRAEKHSAFRHAYVAHSAEGAALFRPTRVGVLAPLPTTAIGLAEDKFSESQTTRREVRALLQSVRP